LIFRGVFGFHPTFH